MKLFKKRSAAWNGKIDPKRLGIIEEIYGEKLDDTGADKESGSDKAAGTPAGDSSVTANSENADRRNVEDAEQDEPIYLGQPSARQDAVLGAFPDATVDGLPRSDARVVVIANAKGGCGKSTSAIHIALGLLDRGASVGTIDLDVEQGTLSRMLENRRAYARAHDIELPMPRHEAPRPCAAEVFSKQRRKERDALAEALERLSDCDVIVVDTPGSHGHMTRLAIGVADTLITPVNDSFLDVDVLAQNWSSTAEAADCSAFTRMIMDERARRERAEATPFDWVVMRNRLSSLYARNKEEVAGALDGLSKQLGFRLSQGFGERVIFREFFPKGLTLLDLQHRDLGVQWTLSHVAAREELRQLFDALVLDDLEAAQATAPVGHAEVNEEAREEDGRSAISVDALAELASEEAIQAA